MTHEEALEQSYEAGKEYHEKVLAKYERNLVPAKLVAAWSTEQELQRTSYPYEVDVGIHGTKVTSATPDRSWELLETLIEGRDVKVEKILYDVFDVPAPVWAFKVWLTEDYTVTFVPAEPDPDCKPVKHTRTTSSITWTCER